MSDIHVLDGQGPEVRIACHVPVPATNNLAGVSHQVAWKHSGHATASVMPIGTEPGQITQVEADALAVGKLAELVLTALPEAKPTDADRLAMLREVYAQARAQLGTALVGLRWFGAVYSKA